MIFIAKKEKSISRTNLESVTKKSTNVESAEIKFNEAKKPNRILDILKSINIKVKFEREFFPFLPKKFFQNNFSLQINFDTLRIQESFLQFDSKEEYWSNQLQIIKNRYILQELEMKSECRITEKTIEQITTYIAILEKIAEIAKMKFSTESNEVIAQTSSLITKLKLRKSRIAARNKQIKNSYKSIFKKQLKTDSWCIFTIKPEIDENQSLELCNLFLNKRMISSQDDSSTSFGITMMKASDEIKQQFMVPDQTKNASGSISPNLEYFLKIEQIEEQEKEIRKEIDFAKKEFFSSISGTIINQEFVQKRLKNCLEILNEITESKEFGIFSELLMNVLNSTFDLLEEEASILEQIKESTFKFMKTIGIECLQKSSYVVLDFNTSLLKLFKIKIETLTDKTNDANKREKRNAKKIRILKKILNAENLFKILKTSFENVLDKQKETNYAFYEQTNRDEKENEEKGNV